MPPVRAVCPSEKGEGHDRREMLGHFAGPDEGNRNPMTQGDNTWKKLRHFLQVLVAVGILAQLALWLLSALAALLLRATFRGIAGLRLAGLLMLPTIPGMYLAATLFGRRGMEDVRPFLWGLVFNSLIYTALWLVGERVLGRWRARRRTAGGQRGYRA